MITLRRLFAAALMVHGAIHMIGVAVTWELATFDDFRYSTEVIGGRDLGTAGIRVLGLVWLAAAAAFVIAGLGVMRGTAWAFRAIVGATVLSGVACLLQVDAAWRGLAIDLVLVFCIATWSTYQAMQPKNGRVTR